MPEEFQRRDEVKLEDVNFFDPDSSADMFYGRFVKQFPHPKGEGMVGFVYRRIDPGTLLELTDAALLIMGENPSGEPPADAPSLEELRMLKVRQVHRLEVLQKCIVRPQFKNLDQLNNVPLEWQVVLYNLIMHGVLGGDTATVSRFHQEGEVDAS